jgi:geranylgeranyl diphosphate synthase type II
MVISCGDSPVGLDILQEIHTRKTGMLIASSLEFGAILGSASTEESLILKQFGLKIGLAFQIVDDILDVTCSKEKHGRDVASDLIDDKTTYISLVCIYGSKQLAELVTQDALVLLE